MGSRDFVYNLILKQDRQSFESGARSLDKVSNNISRMIGVARNAAAALGAMHMIMGEGKALQTANAIGVTSKRLDEFKVAAKISGVSADGLVQSMASLDQAMTDYAFGKNNPGLERALGILSTRSGMSMNIENLRSMDAADRIEYVLKAAQKLTNKKEAASLVSDILGTAGKDFYWALETGGKSIEAALAQARGTIFADDSSKQKAFGFTSELNETLAIMQQIGGLTFAELGSSLTPFLKEINSFFVDNKDAVVKGIKDFSKAINDLATELRNKFGPSMKPALDTMKDLLEVALGIMTLNPLKVVEGAVNATVSAGGTLAETLGIGSFLRKKSIEDTLKKLPGKTRLENLNPITKAQIQNHVEMGGKMSDFSKWLILDEKSDGRSMKDGIMRPDGTITRVAPDDWVFAARSVGDLARMFMPQSMQPAYAGGGSVVINQTLNLSGGADFPQSARRAAYDGTMEALRKMDATRERRFLMPGTR